MASRIVPSKAGLAKLQVEPTVLAARAEWAETLAEEARTMAPEETGRYRDGIVAEGASVGSTFFTAHFIEWGTVDTPVFGVIRKAVESAGLRLDLEPKS